MVKQIRFCALPFFFVGVRLVIGQEFPDEDDTRSLSVDSSISELTPPATEDRCYLSAGKVALHQQLAARSCRP
eukprot:g7510.t1